MAVKPTHENVCNLCTTGQSIDKLHIFYFKFSVQEIYITIKTNIIKIQLKHKTSSIGLRRKLLL